jgi:hypothetical protein
MPIDIKQIKTNPNGKKTGVNGQPEKLRTQSLQYGFVETKKRIVNVSKIEFLLQFILNNTSVYLKNVKWG